MKHPGRQRIAMKGHELAEEERRHQQAMAALLRRETAAAGGAIPFDRYMELALYAPGLGYYVAGTTKFGSGGDFVTAPELSPLFARALAAPCAEVLEALGGGDLLEFGAGSGRMAVGLLRRLEELGALPQRYLVLEVSPELRRRQRQTLEREAPELLDRVVWLEGLPERFRGVMLANEVLDAMPVHRFRKGERGLEEQWVTMEGDRPAPRWRPASPQLASAVEHIEEETGTLAPGYESEVNLRLAPWLAAVGAGLERGVLLLIDYGHPRPVYYHPQRHMGTLRCHFRHRVHDDPFFLPGLQDITAHVDFTAVAEGGGAAGLERLGYATQARFLLGCGLDRLLAASDPEDVAAHMALVQGVRRLLSPDGMGEQFKVMALGKGLDRPLAAFSGLPAQGLRIPVSGPPPRSPPSGCRRP